LWISITSFLKNPKDLKEPGKEEGGKKRFYTETITQVTKLKPILGAYWAQC
jgi:hypothetical protein